MKQPEKIKSAIKKKQMAHEKKLEQKGTKISRQAYMAHIH